MENICKVCRGCGESKPIESLRKHKKSTYGVEALCKKCDSARPERGDPEKIKISHRKHQKTYRDRNPLIRRVQVLHYWARKSGAIGRFTVSDVKAKFIEQESKCKWCGIDVSTEFHIDHATPLCKGGSNWPNNIVISCPSCNDRKGRSLPEDFMRKISTE